MTIQKNIDVFGRSSIGISYKITEKETDINLVSSISTIAARNDLYCHFDVSSFDVRFFYLTGESTKIKSAYEELKLL